MNKTIPVSVIIRSMDRPTLLRALDSVCAQEQRPCEIIVVAACGERHRPLPPVHSDIKTCLVLPGGGKDSLDRPRAANRGLDSATSDWIAFLDDDDEYLPHHLSTLWPTAQAAFQRHGREGRLAYSLAQGVDASGQSTDLYGRSFSLVQIWDSTILHTMNGLLHRSLIDDGCRFDETLDVLEDWDFWIQCSRHTGFTFVELATTRWHGAAGQSGCGFNENYDQPRYVAAQRRVQAKWSAQRDAALSALHAARMAAHAARARGDEHESIRLARWVLRRDPDNADMANLLGMLVLKRGDVASAAQLIEAAIRLAPAHPGLFLNMGIVEQARGNREAARTWFEKALAMKPGDAALIQRLAEVS